MKMAENSNNEDDVEGNVKKVDVICEENGVDTDNAKY